MTDRASPRRRRKRRRWKIVPHVPVRSRRAFLIGGLGAVAGGLAGGRYLLRPGAWLREKPGRPPIRPPTASRDDAAFRAACIRCGLCGTVCENGCIRYFGADEPHWGALTPYLDVRRRSCTLCMRCTNICPTGALTPVAPRPAPIKARVKMATAVVDPDRCLSYLGRICGYCHDACPYPNEAIRLVPPARPVVIEKGCVGCGRCVELCPQVPTAIDLAREVTA